MNNVAIHRVTVPLVFSRDFESRLINNGTGYRSLSDDLELAIRRGLLMIEELEDVRDLEHTETIKLLIKLTTTYMRMDSVHFTAWHIAISQDILDQIDLLILTHGEDLTYLGMQNIDQASAILLMATAGLVLKCPLISGSSTRNEESI